MIKFKKFLGIASAIAVISSFAGCMRDEQPLSEPEPMVPEVLGTEATEKTEPQTEQKSLLGINPLTGESGYNEAADGKRPVAIMVNNIKAALPQYGIEQADIIYELPVEGGITRLMAVYADYTNVPDVCSVRSCRYYFPLLCIGMDAIYCHWGSDQTIALDTLKRTKIDHIDGGYEKKLFYRDEERVKTFASEHTGYLKGSELPEKIAEKGFRTDKDDIYSGTMFSFAEEGDEVIPDERKANNITLNFSGAYYSTFKYSTKSRQYRKYHSGEPHIDQKTENQLLFDNIFILQTDIDTREDGYLLDVELKGGSGYYITRGGAQEIKWKKKSESFPIEFYDSEGNELSVNVGESYIGIIGEDKTVTIK